MRKRLVVFLLCVCWAFYSNAEPANVNISKLIGAHKCKEKINKVIGKSLVNQSWMPVLISEPMLPSLNGVYFRNTKNDMAYKAWIRKDRFIYELVNNRQKQTNRVVWGKNCKKTLQKAVYSKYPPLFSKSGFTDIELSKLVSKNDWGIIYVWSPYMPLSITAMANIKKAMEAIPVSKRGKVTVLVDPKAPDREISRTIASLKINKAYSEKVASHELMERQITLHYPVVLMYKNGFLSNRSYVGHKSEQVYKNWLAKEFQQISKDVKWLN